uniref:Winged helix-turn helix n=1 Tax=Candidatus Kentrum eta TaxID=2126337 RepID=A0A450UI21_9GAMM|nr:MAG: Winged helix-turn helix [Candidatus Kentron sp. H]VFJ93117.1 MAG: Winged helix-turn helix [Candidatus Kentron sp. H]VFJ99978.1 MAG: Winged helix-turn helix [Candidatus Kentron sp. H]
MLHTNDPIIKHKVGLLNPAEELQNISKACQVMGLSRETFYRYKQAVEDGGVESLLNKDRRKSNPKNRVDERTEAAVVQHAIDYPAHGQARTSNQLRKQGIFVSWSGVRSIWPRHGLACFKKRLCVLSKKK